jgi:hypothetical protein
MCTPASPPFRLHALVSRRLAIPSGHPLPFLSRQSELASSLMSRSPFVSLPAPVVFYLPPIGALTPEAVCLPTGRARWSSVVSLCGGEVTTACPEFLCARLPEPGGRPRRHISCLQLEGIIESLAFVLLLRNSSCRLRRLSLTPSAKVRAAFLLLCCFVESI